MAIAAYPATVKIGSNTIQDVMTVELPLKMDTVETTSFGGSGGATVGTKTFIPTLLSATFKMIANWNKADTNGQLLLETAFFARTLVTLIFSPNTTNTYTATFWITDYPIKADTKGVVGVDYSCLMNGGITLV
jgi:hypothetical protein